MAKSPVSFAAGDEVEISCDDEGFRGAWYEARVVRSMPKLRRYSIVYETLMDESDPAKNLRETVDGTHVRPRPPRRATSYFELHQPVDAFHNDGWWTGVISRVQEEGVERRYTVCFPESKEELEFRAKEIRIHMEWVDGEWILPQLQDNFTMSQNSSGIESIACRRLLHAISIAHKSKIPLLGTTLSGGRDEDACKPYSSAANLDSNYTQKLTFQIQPESSQPCKKSKNGKVIPDNLQLLDYLLMARGVQTPAAVEAGFKVTTPVIEERSNLPIRPFMDNQLCSKSPIKESAISLDMVTNSPSNTLLRGINNEPLMPGNFSPELLVQHTPLCTIEPSITEEESIKHRGMGYGNQSKMPNFNQSSIHSLDVDVRRQRRFVAAPRRGGKVPFHGGLRQLAGGEKGIINRGRPRKERIMSLECTELKQLEEKNGVVIERGEQSVRKRDRPQKVRIIDTKASLEGTELKKLEGKDVAHESKHTTEEVEMFFMDFGVSHEIQLCHVDGNLLRDNVLKVHTENDKQDGKEANDPSNEGKCTSLLGTAAQELSDTVVGSNARVVEIAKSAQPSEAGKEAQDKALILPLEDQIAQRANFEDRTETNPTSDTSPSKKTYLPFTKSSSMWEFIKSLEVFSTMPQQPHFRPLEQYSEEFREGMAVGLMVTFANLVENIRKLRIVDSQDIFEEKMKTLVHLEGYGFNVQPVQALLEELRRIKGNLKQFGDKKSALEGLVLEKQNRKDEFDAKIEAIDKAVVELERSLKLLHDEKASIIKQREDNDHEILKLQNDVRAVEESSLTAERDFQGALAGA